MCTQYPWRPEGDIRFLESELELGMNIMMWVLRAELLFYPRAVCAINC